MAKNMADSGDTAVRLWKQLASQLISIIGEGGFHALYARSLFLVSKEFPLLASGEVRRPANLQFTDLKAGLERQGAADAGKASGALLVTFTDVLASLIGDTLTTDILISAWGGNASDRDIAGKEFPNE